MKNNEKFLLDLENIPDRFLDEVNNAGGNTSVVSEVRKEKIHWMPPVSVAALVAAVIAVPVFIFNLKPVPDDDNDNERPAVTEETTVFTEESVTSSESQTSVSETEAQTSPVTVVETAISDVSASLKITVPETTAENNPEENRQPETAPAETEPEVTVTEDPEKKIIQSIGYHYLDDSDSEAERVMNHARNLPEQYLGTIADEQDLTDKVRNFYINEYGLEYVENMERDYDILNGEVIHFERLYPKYSTKYFEELNAWYIDIMPPDGSYSEQEYEVTQEDGTTAKVRKQSVTLDYTGPYLIIRAGDGKILAYNKYSEENIKWSNENY
jgi:hypothetical protein